MKSSHWVGTLLAVGLVIGCGQNQPAPKQSHQKDGSQMQREELKKFAGTWRGVAIIDDGTTWPAEEAARQTWGQDAEGNYQVFVDGQLVAKGIQNQVDPTTSPKTIRGVDEHEGKYVGIYRFVGDTVEMCTVDAGQPPPTEFVSRPGSGYTHEVWKRVADEGVDRSIAARTDPVQPTRREAKEEPVAPKARGDARERIGREVQELMKRQGVPGVSLVVIDDFVIEWAQGYGVRDVAGNDAVDSETLFQAASISKPLTALAALRLVEEGKLNLDEDVNARLASWKIPANQFTTEQPVTLRHLLSHRAGLTVHGFGGYSAFHPIPTLLEVLDGVPGKSNSAPIRVVMEPGAQEQYSGGGYCVVQQLLMDVSGKEFPELMRLSVLDPLGMQHSTYDRPLPEAIRTLAATAHASDGQPILGRWHTYPEMAAAGLWTTPSDLARFVIEIQSAWAGRPDRLISQRTAREMLTPRQPGGMGLGLMVSGDGTHVGFHHGGSNAGFIGLLVANVAGKGAVVMTNSDNGGELVNSIIQPIAREYKW